MPQIIELGLRQIITEKEADDDRLPARQQALDALASTGIVTLPAPRSAAGHKARSRRTPIKAALLAGDIVVGAGNIYVSEALHRAGIDPRTRCGSLSRPRCDRLLAALRLTLARALIPSGDVLRVYPLASPPEQRQPRRRMRFRRGRFKLGRDAWKSSGRIR